MQECVYIVQDTCSRHQRLDATHHWHLGKHVTKRWSCWSIEKTDVCMHEGKSTSLWTSAILKHTTQLALFRVIDSLWRKKRFASFPLKWLKSVIITCLLLIFVICRLCKILVQPVLQDIESVTISLKIMCHQHASSKYRFLSLLSC